MTTTPQSFFVDKNGQTQRAGVAVDATGAATLVTVDAFGQQVTAPLGGSSSAIARSTAQLAGVPTSFDLALGGGAQFYDPLQSPLDGTHPWIYYSATPSAYVPIATGGGGGTPASAVSPKATGTGVIGTATPYARQDHAHPINTAVDLNVISVAQPGWNAAANTGPTLTSGTAPATGINTYIVGTSGTTNLDGISSWSAGGPGVNPDIAQFNGTAWTKIAGSTVLGPYATAAALLSALTPGAGNAGARALVGAGVPYAVYTCDGTAWTSGASGPIAINSATTLSNGNDTTVFVCTSTPAVTVNTGLKPSFGCSFKGAFTTAGTATISDLRQTTGTAACCLVPTDTTGAGLTYDLWGTK